MIVSIRASIEPHTARYKRVAAVLAVLFLAAWLLPSRVVMAHANYVRSIPEADSASPTAPSVVQVWFSEDVAPANSTLTVRDVHGLQVDFGGTQIPQGETKSLLINLRSLTPGIYTVIWKTVSLVDGHDTGGSFPFTVGPASAPVSYAQLLLQDERSARALELPAAGNALVNLFLIGSFTLLTGALAFQALVMRRSSLAEFRQVIAPAYQKLLWVGLAASVGAVAMATAVYVLRAGSGALAGRYGLVLAGRIVFLAMLAVIIRWRKAGAIWTLLPAVGLLLTQSLLSHSAAEDAWLMPLLADWAHFICTAVWLGGVAVLALVVAPVGLKDRSRLKDLGLAISGFSPPAVFCVFAIGITGLAQSASFVGSTDALFATAYGRAIIGKIALLLALIAFGAFHQQVISPRLQEWRLRDITGARTAARRFRISVLAEAAISVVLLVVVAVLVALPPARDVMVDPQSHVLAQTQADAESGLVLTLGVAPAMAGQNQFDLYVRGGDNEPLLSSERIVLRFDNRSTNAGESEVVLQPYGNGHYIAQTGALSMVGQWQVTAIVRRLGMTDARGVFSLDLH